MTTQLEAMVDRQVHRWYVERDKLQHGGLHGHAPKPVITISRLLGSGASEVARQVAEALDCELVGIRIMDEVARRSQIRKELVDALDERVRTQVGDWLDWIFHHRSMDSDEHYRHLLEVMNYFMEMGNVVLLGRGAGFIPKTRPRLDIRIVAPMTRREQRVMDMRHCNHTQAMMEINESDSHREHFIKFLFGEDWWDGRNYDLVVNTGNMTVQGAVDVIKSAWKAYAEMHRTALSYPTMHIRS